MKQCVFTKEIFKDFDGEICPRCGWPLIKVKT